MVIHCDRMSDEALIRRERLKSLKLSPTELAARMPVPEDGKARRPSYFSDLMNKPGKSFGEKAARAIEQALGLPHFWLDGREDVTEDHQPPGGGPDVSVHVKGRERDELEKRVLAALDLIRSQLVQADEPTGERAGEALKRLAINPDSDRAFSNAVDGLLFHPADPSSLIAFQVKHRSAAPTTNTQWRMQAMRLAEAHPDARSRALLIDFLGKLDTLMREQSRETENQTETRHGNNSPTSLPR